MKKAKCWTTACDRCEGDLDNYPSELVFASGGRLDMHQFVLCVGCAKELSEQLNRFVSRHCIISPESRGDTARPHPLE